ncbi:hypothetical protein SteCoe_26179 [Stentor coeruleus]|uniref:Uncharacterized protein n=1 Tax=Stentor coeruleus TaxID=5963 RepID=A0A1R2BDH2_9CILI|nr:hypothetical protein SteCoe_26179 [Stentor coeruleus]
MAKAVLKNKGKNTPNCDQKEMKSKDQLSQLNEETELPCPKLLFTQHFDSKIQFNNILKAFFLRDGNNCPKREIFNAFIIRNICRFCRCLLIGKIPKKTAIKIDHNDTSQCLVWEEGLKLHRCQREMVEEISKIPKNLSSKQIEHRNSGKMIKAKSFNNSFCKDFFQKPVAKSIFSILLMIFFTDITSEGLVNRFQFKCCKNSNHNDICKKKWWDLEKYMKESYLKDLGVEELIDQNINMISCEIPMEVTEDIDDFSETY